MDCQSILQSISEKYRELLRENLVGIYVHGSVAFQCFNWDKSDIDYIVVVDRELSHETKRALMDFTVELNGQAPKKGLEMSVVRREHCAAFRYPTPFELHFSIAHLEWYRRNPDDYCERMRGEDPDLAAHFTIIRHTGLTLCGEPIDRVFGDVPKEDYLYSIRNDVADAKDEILKNPIYITLNLCRVAAYVRQGLILSKEQGGLWGVESLAAEYRETVLLALRCYRTDEEMVLGKDEADAFYDGLSRLIF